MHPSLYLVLLLVLPVRVVVGLNSDLDSVLLGRVGVAECRSKCLVKFPGDCSGGDCFMCWDVCGLLPSQTQPWSHMCLNKQICFKGCEAACSFYLNENRTPSINSSPVSANLDLSSPLVLNGCSVSWGSIAESSNSFPGSKSHNPLQNIVYIVLGKDGAGKWYEVEQTNRNYQDIDLRILTKLEELLLMAVSQDGLVTSSRIVLTRKVSSCETERNYRQPRTFSGGSSLRSHTFSSWSPVLAGVARDGSMARAQVSWQDPGKVIGGVPARFLVRWELVSSGQVVGSSLTNATSISIPLYNLHLYNNSNLRVYVRLLGSNFISTPLTIETNIHNESHINLSPLLFGSAAVLLVISFGFGAIAVIRCTIIKNQTKVNNNNGNALENSTLILMPPNNALSNDKKLAQINLTNLKTTNITNDKLTNIIQHII